MSLARPSRNRRLLLALGLGLLLAAGCQTPSSLTASMDGPYYTQSSVRLEKGRYRTTNYRSERNSLLLPINTEVQILGARGDFIEFSPPGGQVLRVEHVPNHTQDTIDQAFDKLFAREKVDLSAFPEDQREAIEKGQVKKGMSREAVLAALGHPPAVGTLSLDSDTWKYWNTRFTTFDVLFDDEGRVRAIRK